jgi:hypothetical protein
MFGPIRSVNDPENNELYSTLHSYVQRLRNNIQLPKRNSDSTESYLRWNKANQKVLKYMEMGSH